MKVIRYINFSDETTKARLVSVLIISAVFAALTYTGLTHSVVRYSLLLSKYQKQYAELLITVGNQKIAYAEVITSRQFENEALEAFVPSENPIFVRKNVNVAHNNPLPQP